nr:biotin-dependent carboxyltransferase family protein [Thalassotalea sp. G2M2-11]
MATLQDLGRDHAQHLGFSGSGAADEFSFLLANHLLQNSPNSPALEIVLGQVHLTANSSCQFVLTGADCHAQIIKQGANADQGQKITNNRSYHLAQGDSLQLHMPRSQLLTYLAVKNGFEGKKFLNSLSQATNEFNLAFTEPAIKQGTRLALSSQEQATDTFDNKIKPHRLNPNFHQEGDLVLRFIPSQLWHDLPTAKQEQFTEQYYQISAQANRMGYRLQGNALTIDPSAAGLSKPVCFGTIQCPSDGQPIVLMKDRQTIGGYPVLGTVIQTDLFRLSQKRPGNKVSFLPITIGQAQAQLSAFLHKFP